MNARKSEPARVVAWDRAVAEVRAAVARLGPAVLGASGPVIGVCGPVGAGKSTLARRLSECVISTDDYLPDYDRVAFHLRDRPESADLERLAADLGALRSGRPAEIPCWSFHSHKRESYRIVAPPPAGSPVVCEGLHALHSRLSGVVDLRVFVDASRERRWERWKALEEAGERGWGVEESRRFFDEVAEPTFGAVAEGYRSAAHVIVIND